MILTHVWLCGRMVWRLLTLAQWRALPHLSQDMIAWRLTKAAIGGTALVCAGTGAYVVPRLVSGPPAPAVPIARQGPVPTPEPGTLAVLGVGVVGLVVVTRRKSWHDAPIDKRNAVCQTPQ